MLTLSLTQTAPTWANATGTADHAVHLGHLFQDQYHQAIVSSLFPLLAKLKPHPRALPQTQNTKDPMSPISLTPGRFHLKFSPSFSSFVRRQPTEQVCYGRPSRLDP